MTTSTRRTKVRWVGGIVLSWKRFGLSVGAAFFLFPFVSKSGSDNTYRDIQIPQSTGVDFPTPESVLITMRNNQKTSQMRAHAWAVFAGLTQPSVNSDPMSTPIWETWYTRSETFGSGCLKGRAPKSTLPELEFPRELLAGFQSRTSVAKQIDGLNLAIDFFSDPRKSIRSNVLFNAAACEHIRKFGLYDKELLKRRLSTFYKAGLNAPPEERDIPPFPPASIVAKAIWLTIDADGSDITVWDSIDSTGATCPSICGHTIRVTPANKGEACNLANHKNDPVLSSCFYNIPVTNENQGIFKSSITVEPGDVLVLVGLHVITKEIPDWVWSTFWWSPNADRGRFAADKFGPNIIRGAWRNYLMDLTLSMETPRESQEQGSKAYPKIECTLTESPSAKICFNPYLEGNLPDRGQFSNCMNCHKQATFHGLVPDPRGLPGRGYIDSSAPCFSPENTQVMRVDYLWSLAPLENRPLIELLGRLQMDLSLRQKPRQH